jgi:hypothetical protein
MRARARRRKLVGNYSNIARERARALMTTAEYILNEIEVLRNGGFDGWSDGEIRGYWTALKTIEEKIREYEARRQA